MATEVHNTWIEQAAATDQMIFKHNLPALCAFITRFGQFILTCLTPEGSVRCVRFSMQTKPSSQIQNALQSHNMMPAFDTSTHNYPQEKGHCSKFGTLALASVFEYSNSFQVYWRSCMVLATTHPDNRN
eukprot:6272818-Amphidinium_carterae.1